MLNPAAQIPGGINRNVGVVAVDLHPQLDGAVGHPGTDGAQTDDAQHLAGNFIAHKLLFAFFHILLEVGIAGQVLGPGRGRRNIPAAGNQHAHHQLGHRVGVGAGGVEDHDALFAAPVQGDVVDAGTRPGNGQQVGLELGVQQVGTPHQDAVGGVGVHRHLKQIFGQFGQPHRADGI